MSTSTFPVTEDRLTEITSKACSQTLQSATAYEHAKASEWNTAIINSILQGLISAVPPQSYKFSVNSTVIQQQLDETAAPTGPRGMHSASGAFWNTEKDGQWSYKVDGVKEGRAFDIVISVVWIGT